VDHAIPRVSSIVYQNVELSKGRDRLFDQTFRKGRVSHVSSHSDGLTSTAFDLISNSLCFGYRALAIMFEFQDR
jgi:hypothetical protein